MEIRTVLICGASRGIGLACSRKFYEFGAVVIRVARSSDGLTLSRASITDIRPQDSENLVDLALDCASESDMKDCHNLVVEKYRTLSTMVLCIGSGSGSRDPLPSRAEFDESRAINWDVIEIPSRALIKAIRQDGLGSVVFVSSIAGQEVIDAPIPYAVNKAAVMVLAKKLSVSLGPEIRVNCVSPGNILTEDGYWRKLLEMDPRQVKERLERDVPLKRLGFPGEIANAIYFLASDDASFITGATLAVDGGQTRTFL